MSIKNLGLRPINKLRDPPQKLLSVAVTSKELGPLDPAHHDVMERHSVQNGGQR